MTGLGVTLGLPVPSWSPHSQVASQEAEAVLFPLGDLRGSHNMAPPCDLKCPTGETSVSRSLQKCPYLRILLGAVVMGSGHLSPLCSPPDSSINIP